MWDGGVLFDPRGRKERTFSWNLGVKSNNSAGALPLWMSLNIILKGAEIRNIDIFRDSQVNQNSIFINPQLGRVLIWIGGLLNDLNSYNFFHIRRVHNVVVDGLLNNGCQLGDFVFSIDRNVKNILPL